MTDHHPDASDVLAHHLADGAVGSYWTYNEEADYILRALKRHDPPLVVRPADEVERLRAMKDEQLDAVADRWRIGRKVGRTIYLQSGPEPSDTDPLIGVMDTPELAARVVDAVNAEGRGEPYEPCLCTFDKRCKLHEEPTYRVALRPNTLDADPMAPGTLMDDIVVRDVEMFHAEQMSHDQWWVCCYLAGSDERITWSVHASARPKRIDWRTEEYPDGVRYEHEEEEASDG